MTSENLTVPGQFSWTEGYGYDANGHLAVRYTPSGQRYITQPDALGRPTELGILYVNTYITGVTYHPDGHIASFHWLNGLTHQVTENVRGLPSEIHDSKPGNNVVDLTYAYDADGNPAAILDIAGDGSRNTAMTYDGLNRLTSAWIAGVDGGLKATYSYDALGQITQVAQGSRQRTYIYGNYYSGRLYEVDDNEAGTTTFDYDYQGNLAKRNGVVYDFDYGNRLRSVSGEEHGYVYDAYGRRVGQTDSTGTLDSFYDHTGKLIYQRDRAGGTHDYLYLGGKLVAIRNYDTGGIARGWYYQHSDALGSIIRQTDNNAQDVPNTAAVYDAWGGMHRATPHDAPGYTGHMQDADTGLVYMQQRYYDPEVGRFLSMDPVQASGTTGANLDRYWYASDSPYRYTDPDGRQSCTGSHLGHCGGENLTVYQVGEPSAPTAKIAHEMVSNKPADRVSAAHSAMNYFGIKPISGKVDIRYNANMSRQVYGDILYVKGQGVVTLGPSAYVTWAHLGSTLGHEIDVHWNMQMLIFQRNPVDSHERDRWEMDAYMYNIRNANRFGNSPGDIAEFKKLYQDYKYDLQHRPDSLDVSLH